MKKYLIFLTCMLFSGLIAQEIDDNEVYIDSDINEQVCCCVDDSECCCDCCQGDQVYDDSDINEQACCCVDGSECCCDCCQGDQVYDDSDMYEQVCCCADDYACDCFGDCCKDYDGSCCGKRWFDDGCDYCYNWMVELKQGYFYPQDKYLRDMFQFRGSKGGYMVEGAARWRFWRGFNLELNGSYFSREGCALVCCMNATDPDCCCCSPCGSCCNSCSVTCNTGCCSSCNYFAGECVKYKLGTFGLSLKYYFELCNHDWLVPYVGAGGKLFLVSICNGSPYVQQYERYRKFGGVIHGGLLFRICSGFFADLFVDYLAKTLNCGNCCPQLKVGGVFAGVGIGYQF